MPRTITRSPRQALGLVALVAAFLLHVPAAAEKRSQIPLESGKKIELALDTAVVLKAGKTVTRVSIAEEAVADVNVLTPTQILLVAGKKPGETSLIVWHGDEDSEVYPVRTYVPDYYRERIEESIRELAPGAHVAVHVGVRGVVLRGMVRDRKQLAAVLAAAQVHVASVINLIDVSAMLEERLRGQEPDARVAVTLATSGVILEGETTDIEQAQRIVRTAQAFVVPLGVENQLMVRGSQQVQLEVTVAEISHSHVKQMGFGYLYGGANGGGGLYPNGAASAGNSLERTHSYIESDEGVTEALTQLSGLFTNTQISAPFSSAFQIVGQSYGNNALGMISLLKGKGLAKVLAKPTLVTMSGQEASFLVGGEFPVPMASDEGQTNIEYQSYGVQLRFRPMVVGRETITIEICPEFSSPDLSLGVQSGGVAVPGIKTRRSEATLQLKDGQTFVMAGLLREETSQSIDKLPFLGDIPVLGMLFTRKEWQKEETELVIVVRPTLVRALDPDAEITLPGQAVDLDTDDLRFFLLNRPNRDDATPVKLPGEELRSPKGGEADHE